MGTRTKFQSSQVAQLVVEAYSKTPQIASVSETSKPTIAAPSTEEPKPLSTALPINTTESGVNEVQLDDPDLLSKPSHLEREVAKLSPAQQAVLLAMWYVMLLLLMKYSLMCY